MNSMDVPPTRVRTAFALSIAAHVCAFCLLAMLLSDRPAILSSALDNGPAFIVTTIERRAPRPPARRRAASAASTIVPRPVPGAARTAPPVAQVMASYPTVKAPVTPARVVPPSSRGPGSSAPRAASASARASLALVVPAATATPTPAPTVAPATPLPSPTVDPATPAPTQAPTPMRSATLAENFGGLFSQNYPPALAAPSELAAIRARLNGRVRIRVEVDETGHATEVRFVGPLSDPGLEQDIRSTLLALHYVPADCNGLHCEGTLEIAY